MMKYFTIDEICHSTTAKIYGFDNNIIDDDIKRNIIKLIDMLDVVREKFGKPIIVNSGYRCEELNRLVGGARNSQHLYGKAADIRTKDPDDMKELWQAILDSGVEFDQLINEFNFRWIHISWSEKPRHQILKSKKSGAKTIYSKM